MMCMGQGKAANVVTLCGLLPKRWALTQADPQESPGHKTAQRLGSKNWVTPDVSR